jgi:hypothetical protein
VPMQSIRPPSFGRWKALQCQASFIDEHAGVFSPPEDNIRGSHGGAQRIELLPGLSDRLGAGDVLIVTGRADGGADVSPRVTSAVAWTLADQSALGVGSRLKGDMRAPSA